MVWLPVPPPPHPTLKEGVVRKWGSLTFPTLSPPSLSRWGGINQGGALAAHQGSAVSSDYPTGQRFSHVYLAPQAALPDSQRMRLRLATLLCDFAYIDFAKTVARELGVAVTGAGSRDHYWKKFLVNAELRDVLDIITIRFRAFKALEQIVRDPNPSSARWVSGVRRIFSEEKLHYTIDDLAGVHYAVDMEFSRNQVSAIAALQASRYSNARDAFQNAMTAFDAVPPDGKSALRSVFFSAEGLFKLMFPKANLLGGNTVDAYLIPRIKELHAADTAALISATAMARSFREWIISAHKYRHEPGTEEPAQVPISLAILLVSQGAGYIHWLAEIDMQRTLMT